MSDDGLTFIPTALDGVFAVESTPFVDVRGSFDRLFCARSFARAGLPATWAQIGLATNLRRGTLRGLHFQRPPSAEAKLIRCVQGAVHDVVVDLRPDSPTCRRWIAMELRADVPRALFVPVGCAHGYLTLSNGAELLYGLSAPYDPACADGVRWNDPALAISWPFQPQVIADRDGAWPDLPAAPQPFAPQPQVPS